MGVKDGDHLIVTTEMKLPFDEISEDDDPMPGLPDPRDPMIPTILPDMDPYPENTVPVHQN